MVNALVQKKFRHQISVSSKLSRKDDANDGDDIDETEKFRTEQVEPDEGPSQKLKSDLEQLEGGGIATDEDPVNLGLEHFDASEEVDEPEVRADDGDDDDGDLFQSNCGQLGGSAVLQAFGRAAHNLLPGKPNIAIFLSVQLRNLHPADVKNGKTGANKEFLTVPGCKFLPFFICQLLKVSKLIKHSKIIIQVLIHNQ